MERCWNEIHPDDRPLRGGPADAGEALLDVAKLVVELVPVPLDGAKLVLLGLERVPELGEPALFALQFRPDAPQLAPRLHPRDAALQRLDGHPRAVEYAK